MAIPDHRSTTDVLIAGGGIVGLATAYRLTERHPGIRVIVVEKENALATHQTGRNSGVMHSGVYYEPGSTKATNCRAGLHQLIAFCEEQEIPFEQCGKVIVAVDQADSARLDLIEGRGRQNGVTVQRIDPVELREIEPAVRGAAALWVPEAGIVDYATVARRLAGIVSQRGGRILTSTAVLKAEVDGPGLRVATTSGMIATGALVNCAGLFADRLARACGVDLPVRIIPFRGDYFGLREEARSLCRGLIYPVPDPRFPFLGVHLTRRIDGRVDVGPSAVMAFAREGYRLGQVSATDMVDALTYQGFRRLARRYWRVGVREMAQAASKRVYLQAARRLVPALHPRMLVRAQSGVRAQAVAPDGTLLHDFLFADSERAVHVLSAASPAATASLNIGRVIVDRLDRHL